VEVTDLATGKRYLVKANQSMTVPGAAGAEPAVSPIDPKAIDRWWLKAPP